jgi:hypothetical protein
MAITIEQMKADLAQIALEQAGINALEVRNSDNLDFHDLSVTTIAKMLEEAYRKGAQLVNGLGN